MEQAPDTPLLFHVRMVSVMAVLAVVDSFLLFFSVNHTVKKGPSMMIVFGFEVRLFHSVLVSPSLLVARFKIHMALPVLFCPSPRHHLLSLVVPPM